MYRERGETNGYNRLRLEQGREGFPSNEPRQFHGEILRFKHETSWGFVKMTQINDYEALKRIYRITYEFEFDGKQGVTTRYNRLEAGEVYEKLVEELNAVD